MNLKNRRLTIAGLSALGVLDSLYMLAYEEGLIDSLFCPFFGEGCNIVGRSKHARHFGVPNAALGAVSYAAMATLSLWSGNKSPARRPLRLLALGAMSTVAVAASAYLTWEQAAKVRAWCFWCLTSAAINSIILPLSLADAVPAWRAIRKLD